MSFLRNIMNAGQYLTVELLLHDYVDDKYYDEIIKPAAREIGKHNNIKFMFDIPKPIILDDEIILVYAHPYFNIICSHIFYDGKAISHMCDHLNEFITHKKYLPVIQKKENPFSPVKNLVNSIFAHQVKNNYIFGKKKINLIKKYEAPISTKAILKDIQNKENKDILFAMGSKNKTATQGNTSYTILIDKTRSMEENFAHQHVLTRSDWPTLFSKGNYLTVNFLKNFSIPLFTQKMILKDQDNYMLEYVFKYVSDKSYILMPKASDGTHTLYQIIH